MRQIKFRLRYGHRIVGFEKWYAGVEGDVISAKAQWLYSKDGAYWNPEPISHRHKDEFTGLLDKNGVEIYEGDIVRLPGIRSGVIYNNPDKLVVASMCGRDLYPDGYYSEFEVIGNIHQNSALLKSGSEEGA